MTGLHKRAGLSWGETRRYVLKAAKSRGIYQNDRLRQKALANLRRGGDTETEATEFLNDVARASDGSACLAHHLTNAIVSYRTAYLKTHFPEKSRRLLEELVTTS